MEEPVEEKGKEKNYGSIFKQDFLKIFDNKVHIGNFDDSTVKKLDENKPIVYTGYSSTEKTDNYEFNLEVPWINIDSQVAKTYNEKSQEVLVNKIMEIMGSAKDKTIYDISYTVYVYNNTMSVIILSNLKEGSNAQKDMIQTYNYNLKTQELNALLNDFFAFDGGGVAGEDNPDGRSQSFLRMDFEAAAHLLQQFVADGDAESTAGACFARFRTVEAFEFFGRDAVAGVFHRNHQSAADVVVADADETLLGVLDSIFDDSFHHVAHLRPVDVHHQLLVGVLGDETHVLVLGAVFCTVGVEGIDKVTGFLVHFYHVRLQA